MHNTGHRLERIKGRKRDHGFHRIHSNNSPDSGAGALRHHARPDRVQLDVTLAGQQVVFRDYQAMLAAQMFYGDTLPFEAIVERLRRLEAEINSIGRR